MLQKEKRKKCNDQGEENILSSINSYRKKSCKKNKAKGRKITRLHQKIFQLSYHIPRQWFRLIPANTFLIKRPNWNTDVPSHQMYIMTGLKPCWSLTHNWLGISEIHVSQLEQTALGIRMCVTGSCPSNTTAGFFLTKCTCEANHSLNLKSEYS